MCKNVVLKHITWNKSWTLRMSDMNFKIRKKLVAVYLVAMTEAVFSCKSNFSKKRY